MDEDIAIELVGISKKYRLFNSRRDRLVEVLHPFRKMYHQEHWSLRDVDVTFRRGSTVGILGMNGSGKSTLLQIICDVLHPTDGTCRVNGRIAALLELGAGFNPDLTGRENVVTNGLIMGLDRSDIEARLEEVQAFAEIGDFFDQPVRTYSSGMFMRVAFAMAINVDPDILVIDEALAVGDAKFQEKCFRRIKEFQEQGKTILYVTHDRVSVTHLCTDAILLHQGELIEHGTPDAIVALYTELLTTGRLAPVVSTDEGRSEAQKTAVTAADDSGQGPRDEENREVSAFLASHDPVDRLHHNPLYNTNEAVFGNGGAQIIDAMVVEGDAANPGQIMSTHTVDVYVKVLFEETYDKPVVGLTLTNTQGVVVYSINSGWLGIINSPAPAGTIRTFLFRLGLPLAIGSWFLDLAVARSQINVSRVRGKVLMLSITRDQTIQGLVDLGATFEECKIPGDPATAGTAEAATTP